MSTGVTLLKHGSHTDALTNINIIELRSDLGAIEWTLHQ
jgi:hypothetical protein